NLRYQGPQPEHQLGGARGRRRPELCRHVRAASVDGERSAMSKEKLHPDAARVCELIVAANRPPMETLTPPQAREAYLASRAVLQPDSEEVAEVVALEAPGPAGPIRMRLYRGMAAGKDQLQPALIYFHGGGWVSADLKTHDQVCRALANAARCIVVAVDYRLAPEHKFPAAVDDAIAAPRRIRGHG